MASKGKEINSNKSPEKKTSQIRPRELERKPERKEHRDIPEWKRMETQFREKTEKKRILGLPRVEGFDKSGVTTDKEVKEYLKDTFPERHANNITMESVKYNDKYVGDKKETELGHWEKKELGKDLDIYNKDIVINRQTEGGNVSRDEIEATLAHEVGHQTHNMYFDNSDRKGWEKLSGDRPQNKCVSEYARTNSHEDFAESYKAYIRDPESLKKADPEKYNYMQNKVFSGREYEIKNQKE